MLSLADHQSGHAEPMCLCAECFDQLVEWGGVVNGLSLFEYLL